MNDNLIDELRDYRVEKCDFVKGLKFSSFKCYIDKDNYCTIKIFDSREAMLEYCEGDYHGIHRPNSPVYSWKDGLDGKFVGYEDENGNRTKEEISDILLYKDKLGCRVIVHELTHMIFSYFFTWNPDGLEKISNGEIEHEELFCYLLGDCASFVYDTLYKYEII